MDLDLRLELLDQLYAIYGDFIRRQPLACTKGCSQCCTCNLTVTTLEGEYLLRRLSPQQHGRVLQRLAASAERPRYRPTVTLNRLADICAKGEDPPEEENDPDWGACPLLKEDLCPLYDLRPFGCRCMVSRHDCRKTAYAEIDPLVLTAGDLFLQHIEHIDAKGYSGNFSDILLFLDQPEAGDHYRQGQLGPPPEGLLANQPLFTLMIPPEHREAVAPLLKAIRGIRPVSQLAS
jgi:Fe-S-cluster containining protein